MKKLTSILHKIASSLNIALEGYDDEKELLGRWEAISYEEKLYENGQLTNEDILMYNKDASFEIIFKKNHRFTQIEKYRSLAQNVVEKSSKNGSYAIDGNKISLAYGKMADDESVVELTFSISQNELTTINDFERKDLDDVYRHMSKRVFLKL